MFQMRRFQHDMLDKIVRSCPGLGLEKRAEFFTRLFENYLDPESEILDIGGGWGFYDEPLKRRGHHPVVLDVRRPGYQKAPVVLYDGYGRFPFPDKSFDTSLLITVLHHIADPAAVLEEAWRVTRKTVVLIEDLYHHALGRWWTVLRDRIYNFEFFGHPCQFRKREEWLQMVRGLGFSLAEEHRVYTWLGGLRILNGLFVLKIEAS